MNSSLTFARRTAWMAAALVTSGLCASAHAAKISETILSPTALVAPADAGPAAPTKSFEARARETSVSFYSPPSEFVISKESSNSSNDEPGSDSTETEVAINRVAVAAVPDAASTLGMLLMGACALRCFRSRKTALNAAAA